MYSKNSSSAIINVMKRAILKAGKITIRDFGELEHLQISGKSPLSFAEVTKSKIAKILYEELLTARPNFRIIIDGKLVHDTESELLFDLEILDGIDNFIHSLTFFTINLSLQRTEQNKTETISSLIYAPILDELYIAEKNSGARVDKASDSLSKNSRLRVSSRKKLDEALIILGLSKEQKFFKPIVEILNKNNLNYRLINCNALSFCYFVSGRADLIIAENKPYNLFAKESGGFIYDLKSQNLNLTVASNEYLAKEFLSLM